MANLVIKAPGFEVCFEKVNHKMFFNEKEVIIKQLLSEIARYENIDVETCETVSGMYFRCYDRNGQHVIIDFEYNGREKMICGRVKR